MDSRDLRNLSETWQSITSEEVVEEIQQLDEQGRLSGTQRRAQQAQQQAAAAQSRQEFGQRFQSFVNRGGVAGAINRRLQSAVAQGGNPNRRGQGSTSGVRPTQPTTTQAGADLLRSQEKLSAPVAANPAPTAPVRPVRPAAPVAAKPAPVAAKPAPTSTSVAGTFKAVPGAPTQASLATARPAPEKANILGNKASDLAADQAKAKADSLAQAAKNRARGQRPMSARERMLNQDLDLFDIVKGYLLDEGATEEEAIKIMVNMTEEERNSIVEGGINFSVPSRIDDFNNRRDELKNRYRQDVGPRIPGPGGGGQYGEPAAPKATGVRLAKKGKETKNMA